MARMIDADELMVYLHCRMGQIPCDEYGLYLLADVAEYVAKMPAIEAEQEWISVEDRLPPDGNKPYLTCRKTVKGRTVIESRYLHTSYESPCVAYWEGKKNGEVTHWMPLPEPPEAK